MAKMKVHKGMGASKSGKVTKSSDGGSGKLKIDGGFKADGYKVGGGKK